MGKLNSKNRIILGIVCTVLAICLALTTIFVIRPYYYENLYIAPIPTNLSPGWSEEAESIFSDFYVSPNGNDKGDGSLENPFATIEQARTAINLLKQTQVSHAVIALMAGTYNIDSLKFTKADSGTENCRVIYSAYGDGEVIFDGGIKPGTTFTPNNEALLEIQGAEYMSFSGITFRNCAGVAIRASGSNIDISACKIINTGSNGIEINGSSISVNKCNISSTGASAITVNGGNRETLEDGNCLADNNLIDSTSCIYKEAPSIVVSGTGNSVTHNEIINSPGTAVYYSGNNNKVEYNYIHNTCLENPDAVAVDSPFGWDCYGNFIRYNLISTIGNGKDALTAVKACSGTEVRGNMFINIKGIAMDFDGGRDINFTNNIVVNCSTPLSYKLKDISSNDAAWKKLSDSPYKNDIWKKAYPACYSLTADSASKGKPSFAANPAGSVIKNNIILQAKAEIGEICDEANTLSNIDGNMLLKLNETKIFISAKTGNYRIDQNGEAAQILPDYRDIPFDSIGRY